MATKKKKASSKKRSSKAASTGKKVAKTLLGKIAQTGAQLILDSGVLGKGPRKKSAKKKKTRKA